MRNQEQKQKVGTSNPGTIDPHFVQKTELFAGGGQLTTFFTKIPKKPFFFVFEILTRSKLFCTFMKIVFKVTSLLSIRKNIPK